MKKNILKHVLHMTKLFSIAFLFQCLTMSLLLAWNGNAQVKNIEEVKVSLFLEDVKIERVFRELEKSTGYNFVFTNKELREIPNVEVRSDENSLYSVLQSLATQTNLNFKQVDYNIHVKKSEKNSALPIEKIEADITITGTVTDEKGEPIPGATVFVAGTNLGTVTDIDGKFNINVEVGDEIRVSFIGYETQSIKVGNQTQLTIYLKEDQSLMQEVVVVGYGTQRKADITGSVASVGSEALENAASPNIVQALQGVMPGLSVSINSSNAEQTANITIRGEQSITASNNPLIVLDGIPWAGNLSEIPSADVKSIDVLKDASSTAIYGARGANGVILITTNKGNRGQARVSIRSSNGIVQLAKKPDLMNAEQFYNRKLEYLETDPDVAFTQTELENYAAGNSTDWIDIITRMGQQQEHTLSLSGGGDSHLFYISGNFLKTQGIAKNDNFSRYSLRLNFEKDLTDWLRFGTNTSLVYLDRDGVPADFGAAFRMNPLTTPFNEDGTIKIFPWPEDVFFNSPLGGLNAQNYDRDHNLFSNNYFDIDIPFIKGLNYRINTGITYGQLTQETYWDDQTPQGLANRGVSDVSNRNTIRTLVENILNYEKIIGDHTIRLTGLYSFQSDENKMRRVRAEGFPGHVLTTYQENAGTLINPSSSLTQTGLVSQMVRLNYSLKGKYLVTSTMRRDGFSGFGDDTKFGAFPSVALGWNISEENFIANNFNWIQLLKLRASWGKNGNQAIGAYRTLSRLSENHYLGGSTGTTTATGYVPNRLANPRLGWETTSTWNAGIDFMLLNGRLGGSFDVFKSNVSDLLLDRRISSIFGIPGSEITENLGRTENKGLEFGINGKAIQTQNFEWNLALNYSAARNKIVALYGDGQNDLLNRWFIGEPINVYYTYDFGGIWQLDDNIGESAQPNAKPGWVKVVDTNGDGEITPEDRVIRGQTFPDFVGGLNSNFKYKNLSLNLFFSGVIGIERPNELGNPGLTWEYRRNNINTWDYWTPENPTNRYPANKINVNANPGAPLFEDASFVRLRDLRVAYDLSQVAKRLLNVSSFNISFNVNNVFTLTNWTGVDPELSDQESIPLQRIYVMRVNIGF
ncbi:SusC/RagA family TonB-linked outer membrane protein [Lunatimonas salinarum]|uniref:SusC/RagA family TonB-linked outer membrane protein n=1 Tax=Lunatimonas salinarum TaxID=1774590 RepID=UPI001AE06725|nr:SusC/RagA family TonB-linked outer membrane protein [Lunatimonas salinarum]